MILFDRSCLRFFSREQLILGQKVTDYHSYSKLLLCVWYHIQSNIDNIKKLEFSYHGKQQPIVFAVAIIDI